MKGPVKKAVDVFYSSEKKYKDLFFSSLEDNEQRKKTTKHKLENPSYHKNLFYSLTQQTENHISYLISTGFGERAQGIKLDWFRHDISNLDDVDLTSFIHRTKIPQIVIDFNCHLKNTIITTDTNSSENNKEDLKKLLDIRLYPTLKNLIKQHGLEIFLGSKKEMVTYYTAIDSDILFQFNIPSSSTYYLLEKNTGDICIVMAGLVSRENIIAQLLTLKLAEIKVENIEIIGEVGHFFELVAEDIKTLLNKFPELKIGNNVLIIAGCGLEKMVNKIIMNELNSFLGDSKSFEGNIISLVYTPLLNTENEINGLISLNLNYGGITEYIISSLLENCNCKHVFTGGAGGYIPQQSEENKPSIGSRIKITKCMNEEGEIVAIDECNNSTTNHLVSKMHLHIPSIFLETFEWLDRAKHRGNSVDVETFYIIKAIQNYNKKNPLTPIESDCGYFVSDYVGEQPLREYSKVYHNYNKVLSVFLQNIFANKPDIPTIKF